MINVYVSEWGDFQIPTEIFDKTPLEINEKGVVVGALPHIESRHLWNWLHAMEVKAGKPE